MSCPPQVIVSEIANQVAVGDIQCSIVEVTAPGPQGIQGPPGAFNFTQPTTVAALPPSPQGYRAFVTDSISSVFGNAPIGGGTIAVPVFFDGLAWRVG